MSTRQVLIVDDQPIVAFLLSKALERSNRNCHVSVAHSGEEALEMLNDSSMDLLVTDLRMPGISGLELIRWVQACSPQTRTILVTAYGNDEIEAEAHRLEVYRYMTKPVDIGDFMQVVQDALHDVAINRPGLVALSDKSADAITQQLEDLRRDAGAQCVVLADTLGQRLAQAGVITGFDTTALPSLLADGFAAAGTLADQVGGDQVANLNLHQGTRYEIYSTNVDDRLFLTLIYDRRVRASRIGVVWLYTQRAIKRLSSVLSTVEAPVPDQSSAEDLSPSPTAGSNTPLEEEPLPEPRSAGEGNSLAGHQPRAEENRTIEVAQSTAGEPERELLDLEAAIARGLIPADWTWKMPDGRENRDEASPP
jgi:CheY-like chemotaxis protein